MAEKKLDLKNYFFDTHLHLFNLSHPGIIMFLNRLFLNNELKIDDLAGLKIIKILFIIVIILLKKLVLFLIKYSLILLFIIGVLAYIWILKKLNIYIILGIIIAPFAIYFIIQKFRGSKSIIKCLTNTFYFIENDISNQLLLLERDFVSLDKNLLKKSDYLKSEYDKLINNNDIIKIKKIIEDAKTIFINNNKKIKFDSEEIEKVILIPLIMDFGYKKTTSDKIHYKISPSKPMSDQIIDIYYGIKRYLDKSPYKLFEVYPFMGITPSNYLKEDINDILKYYFNSYKRNIKQFQDAFKKRFLSKDFNINFDNKRNFASLKEFFFAGIKLYPSLGCDLDPGKKSEKDKINLIYKFCEEKGIPIAVHFGKGGFQAVDDVIELTDPDKSDYIKKNYKKLRFDFAHFGLDEKNGKYKTNKWHKKIKELINEKNNFYTDLSCKTYNVKSKGLDKILKRTIEENPLFKDRILFGSDIPVVLFGVESYRTYLKKFLDLSNHNYTQFYRENAYNFLFNPD